MSDSSSGEAPLAALVRDWISQAAYSDRAPRVRIGERAPIPATTRFLVHCRDGWRCRWCWFIADPHHRNPHHWLETDHIIPWSAGGSDRSDNLRSLCNLCNTRRSNYVTDAAFARATPCTIWCDPCRELLVRYGVDTEDYGTTEPWHLSSVLRPKWAVLAEVGEFYLEQPADSTRVSCFWGSHISWVGDSSRIA